MGEPIILAPEIEAYEDSNINLKKIIRNHKLDLKPVSLETLQINITNMYNFS